MRVERPLGRFDLDRESLARAFRPLAGEFARRWHLDHRVVFHGNKTVIFD